MTFYNLFVTGFYLIICSSSMLYEQIIYSLRYDAFPFSLTFSAGLKCPPV